MRKFLLSVLIFVSFFCILVYAIGNVEIPEDYLIYKTQGTNYEKIAWNLNLIKNKPEEIRDSYIFLGPSLTQVGICDSTLKAKGIRAVNLGVNHSGNEIELYFLNKIATLKPRKVFLNLSKARGEGLHPMTPMLFTPSYLRSCGQNINVTFGKFLFKRASYVLDYFVWTLIHEKKTPEPYSEYGVIYEDDVYDEKEYSVFTKKDMDVKFYEFADLEKTGFIMKGEENRKGLIFSAILTRRKLMHHFKTSEFLFNTATQQEFVNKSFETGSAQGFEVVELYIPTIIDAKIGKNFDESFYHKRATRKVESIKDFSMLDKAENWYNIYHLSRQGAINFTNELISQGLLQSGQQSSLLSTTNTPETAN